MYRTIIVPLDGSARSQTALSVASKLAKSSGAALELVRVHVRNRPDLDDDPSWDDMFMQGERAQLDALAEAYEDTAGQRAATVLLDAPVVASLCEYVARRPDPLVVMAGRGRTGLRRAVLGSVSDGLVRQGSAPILILRERPQDDDALVWRLRTKPFGTIVVPLDGSPFAEGALVHAVALAQLTDATIHLIQVVEPMVTSPVLGAFAFQSFPPFDEASVIRNDRAHEYLQGIARRATADGKKIRITREVALSSQPEIAITESARRRAADLMVMATHGRGLSRLVYGAVGDHLLAHGPGAILFVHPTGVRLPAGLETSTHAEHPSEKKTVAVSLVAQ